jgi:tRNA G18 (ribose-2'-O)-methylase SpoU
MAAMGVGVVYCGGVVQICHITDAADERLDDYRNLTDAELRAKEFAGVVGRFIAEGPLVVREALVRSAGGAAVGAAVGGAGGGARSQGGVDGGGDGGAGAVVAERVTIRSVLVDVAALEAYGPLLALAGPETAVLAAPSDFLRSVVGFDFHRGILASGVRPRDRDWRALARGARTLVILEALANHDNVGSIFRSTAALAGPGAAVLLTPRSCDPLYRKSLRVSIGLCLRVPFARVEPWPEALGELREMGYEVMALTPWAAARPIGGGSGDGVGGSLVGGRRALVLGAEGPGLERATLAHPAITPIRIPMAAGVDSLNVGVAAAVALSHLVRPGD